MMEPTAKLLAKSEIQDLLARYARGVDRYDVELVRSCFFEDAVDDHGDHCGVRDKFVEWWSNASGSETMAHVSHFIGNCLIEFAADDVAVGETYFICHMLLSSESDAVRKMLLASPSSNEMGTSPIVVQGRYIDRFEKRAETWLIADRRVVYDYSAQGPVESAPSVRWTYGRRDLQDPMYLARARAGLK